MMKKKGRFVHPPLIRQERNLFGEAIRNFLRFGGRRRINEHIRGVIPRGRKRDHPRSHVLTGQRYGKHYAV